LLAVLKLLDPDPYDIYGSGSPIIYGSNWIRIRKTGFNVPEKTVVPEYAHELSGLFHGGIELDPVLPLIKWLLNKQRKFKHFTTTFFLHASSSCLTPTKEPCFFYRNSIFAHPESSRHSFIFFVAVFSPLRFF